MPDLTVWQWLVLAFGAVLMGYSKTAVNGVASIAVVLFAAVLPARESTGALLPLLIAADLVAIWVYRRHANWGLIGRLLPWIFVGLVVGAVFIDHVDNHAMRITIAVLLLVLLAAQTWSARHRLGLTSVGLTEPEPEPGPGDDHHVVRSPARRRAFSLAAGSATGFATMVANSAGPVMTLYLLASGFAVVELVGAAAWLFFVVNLVKLPFSIGLGLVHPGSLLLDVTLLPAMGVGAWVGAKTIRRISRAQFERYVLVLVAISALLLLV
ncbi:MAG: sulfite exporter TauE/SafE family protein [Actinomycetota bacterium]|nr:sulfite exporter TauE/SafE family protein [Actinomycetota bacterium]